MNASNLLESLTVPLRWVRNLKVLGGENADTGDQREHNRRSMISHPLGSSLLPAL